MKKRAVDGRQTAVVTLAAAGPLDQTTVSLGRSVVSVVYSLEMKYLILEPGPICVRIHPLVDTDAAGPLA